jgi:hypothetical protein
LVSDRRTACDIIGVSHSERCTPDSRIAALIKRVFAKTVSLALLAKPWEDTPCTSSRSAVPKMRCTKHRHVQSFDQENGRAIVKDWGIKHRRIETIWIKTNGRDSAPPHVAPKIEH